MEVNNRKRVGNLSYPPGFLSRLGSKNKETNGSSALCIVTPHYLMNTATVHPNDDSNNFICNPDLKDASLNNITKCTFEEVEQLGENYNWNESF